ncbi:MAG: MBL fold metallo-hydrolase [Lachnospiraceae bacterium]|nr:MBL fold metallo-hydrolase [Lachnospiraceae bacterium]
MSDLKIGKMVLSVCATNCYFVYHEGQNKVILFDPADRGDRIYSKLKENGFEVDTILLTHAHFDHIWGCSELRGLSGAKVYALDKEEELLLSSELNASAMAGRPCTVKANGFFKDGDELDILGFKIKVLATPGHTKGSCCFYFEEDSTLISGDTLFEESVGRTDLPTGNMGDLTRSIHDKLAPLPDETKVYPGHGGSTTIGHEREYNPFWN